MRSRPSQIESPSYTLIKKQLGGRLRKLRKTAGITQVEFCKFLGLEQAALSRVESGDQGLTPEHLLRISKYFDIPVDTLIQGNIDFNSISNRFGYVTPTIPAQEASKVRFVLPFLSYLEQVSGERRAQVFLEAHDLEASTFAHPDHLIETHSAIGFVKSMADHGHLKNKDEAIKFIVESAQSEFVSGFLFPVFSSQIDSIFLALNFVTNQHHFTNGFRWEVQKLLNGSLEFSVQPEEFIKQSGYNDPVLGSFFCEYQKALISQLPRYIKMPDFRVEESKCHYHTNSGKCIYRISASDTLESN